MRYKLLIASFLFVSISLAAQDKGKAAKEAEAFYADKNYEQAALIYESLMKQGESADLYYNYANTQFRLNNLGRAILFYERALVLAPFDRDIKSSLEYANSLSTDKINGYESFFLVDWFSAIGKIFNTNQWAFVGIGLFVFALVLGLIFLFASVLSVRKISFYVGLLCMIFSIISLIYAFTERQYLVDNPYAIVMEGSVSVKASPSITGKEIFLLHEGTKVKVVDSQNRWKKIEIADKLVGWVPQNTVEGI